jgi:hypothetical protein
MNIPLITWSFVAIVMLLLMLVSIVRFNIKLLRKKNSDDINKI